MTLQHEPTPWIPEHVYADAGGAVVLLKELAEPLVAECN